MPWTLPVSRQIVRGIIRVTEMSHTNVALGNNSRFKPESTFGQKWLLHQIFKTIGPAPLRLAFGGGEEFSPPGVAPVATVVIRDKRTLAGLVVDPEMAFAEAYA